MIISKILILLSHKNVFDVQYFQLLLLLVNKFSNRKHGTYPLTFQGNIYCVLGCLVVATSLKLSNAARIISCPPRTRQTAARSSRTNALVLKRHHSGYNLIISQSKG